MKRFALLLLLTPVLTGCSGTLTNSPVPQLGSVTLTGVKYDETKADGLRYFKSQNVEIRVYKLYFKKTAAGEVVLDKDHKPVKVIEAVGDSHIMVIPDPTQLYEASFRGALFNSQSITFSIDSNGLIKNVALTSKDNSTPTAVGAISGVQAAADAASTFNKTNQQTTIDDLQRQIDLLTKKHTLAKDQTGQF